MAIVPAAPAAPLRALIYLRVSKAEQLEGYSPDAMEARCREKAAVLGADVVGVLLEDGKGNRWNLPKLNEALRRAEARTYDMLLSYDTARLARDLGKRLWIRREMDKFGAIIRYATIEFSDTPEGRLQEHVMGSFDEYEREKIGARTANGIRQKLDDGHVVGSGRTPYGYEPVLNEKGRKVSYRPKEPEAGIVRRIVTELATQDGTLVTVCRRLNAERVPTPQGAPLWLPGTLRSLLRNTVYVGEYRFGQVQREVAGDRIVSIRADADDVKVVTIPAIVTPAEVQAAADSLVRRRRDRRPQRSADDDPFTLRGLARCGHCGGGLSTSFNGRLRRYACLRAAGRGGKVCPFPQVPADALELHAWDVVVRAMGSHCLRDELMAASNGSEAAKRHASQLASVRADMAKAARRINAAVEVMLDNEKGSTAWTYAKEKQAEAERGLADLETSLALLEREAPRMLSATDGESIWRAALDLKDGMLKDGETPAGRRYWLRKLGVTGTVSLAEGDAGEQLGRKHRWLIAWHGHIALPNKGHDSQGTYLLLDSSARCFTLGLRAVAAR